MTNCRLSTLFSLKNNDELIHTTAESWTKPTAEIRTFRARKTFLPQKAPYFHLWGGGGETKATKSPLVFCQGVQSTPNFWSFRKPCSLLNKVGPWGEITYFCLIWAERGIFSKLLCTPCRKPHILFARAFGVREVPVSGWAGAPKNIKTFGGPRIWHNPRFRDVLKHFWVNSTKIRHKIFKLSGASLQRTRYTRNKNELKKWEVYVGLLKISEFIFKQRWDEITYFLTTFG